MNGGSTTAKDTTRCRGEQREREHDGKEGGRQAELGRRRLGMESGELIGGDRTRCDSGKVYGLTAASMEDKR